MALSLAFSRRRRRPSSWRIASSLFAAVFIAGMFCSFCGAFIYIGANYEGPLRFLEPFRPPTYDEAVALCPVDYALSDTERNDVIFIGDSTCRCGIKTRQFEKLTSLSAYNLGSFASIGIYSQLLTLQ